MKACLNWNIFFPFCFVMLSVLCISLNYPFVCFLSESLLLHFFLSSVRSVDSGVCLEFFDMSVLGCWYHAKFLFLLQLRQTVSLGTWVLVAIHGPLIFNVPYFRLFWFSEFHLINQRLLRSLFISQWFACSLYLYLSIFLLVLYFGGFTTICFVVFFSDLVWLGFCLILISVCVYLALFGWKSPLWCSHKSGLWYWCRILFPHLCIYNSKSWSFEDISNFVPDPLVCLFIFSYYLIILSKFSTFYSHPHILSFIWFIRLVRLSSDLSNWDIEAFSNIFISAIVLDLVLCIWWWTQRESVRGQKGEELT